MQVLVSGYSRLILQALTDCEYDIGAGWTLQLMMKHFVYSIGKFEK